MKQAAHILNRPKNYWPSDMLNEKETRDAVSASVSVSLIGAVRHRQKRVTNAVRQRIILVSHDSFMGE